MNRFLLAIVILGIVAGCSQRPKLTEAIARRRRSSYNAVLQAYGELHRDLPKGQHYAPEEGWIACELLAHVGPPDSVDADSTVVFG